MKETLEKSKKILVTGAAGFVGYTLAHRLLDEGYSVVGVDCVSPYYDVNLKLARVERLKKYPTFKFEKIDIAEAAAVETAFKTHAPAVVFNLAAQAGVRHSLTHPEDYVHSNLIGFSVVLDASKRHQVEHLIYASTGGVFGSNTTLPFKESDTADHPLSLYTATKRSNELMAHSYSAIFKLPTTGIRFFSAYGPWGRPDMALFKFTQCILEGSPIELFNSGNHTRDFTYIDDLVEGLFRVLKKGPPGPSSDWNSKKPRLDISFAPYRIFNLGSHRPVPLLKYIEQIEIQLGKKAARKNLPLQAGDVPDSIADMTSFISEFGYQPSTPMEVGVERFVSWYRDYYKV